MGGARFVVTFHYRLVFATLFIPLPLLTCGLVFSETLPSPMLHFLAYDFIEIIPRELQS
jgi:hypothetical protein